MLLASKYEEIWAPEVRDFVYISDGVLNEQILDMEKQMLNTLGFLTVPTPYQFLSRFYKAAGADKQFQLLASFVSNQPAGLLDAQVSGVAPAAAAAMRGDEDAREGRVERRDGGAHAVHRLIFGRARTRWRGCSASATASLSAVHKKYSNPKFMEVARLPAPAGLEGAGAHARRVRGGAAAGREDARGDDETGRERGGYRGASDAHAEAA